MTTFEYKRLDRWVRSGSNGWTGPAVSARFEAGARGEDYLEYLLFNPTITEQPAARELLGMLTRTNLRRATVLDFGCGNAVLRELLGAAKWTPEWSYVGVDINPFNVESCRRRFPESRFEVVVENEPLPFPDESVDVVVAGGVLECTEYPADLLSEFQRISRAWVCLCRLGVRETTAPPAIYWQSVGHTWGVEEHSFHVFSRTDLERMIKQAGLHKVWEELSVASGEWIAPDDPMPLQHFSFLLSKSAS